MGWLLFNGLPGLPVARLQDLCMHADGGHVHCFAAKHPAPAGRISFSAEKAQLYELVP